MDRKPKNIFLHFLNKDTQEIFGFCKEWDPYTHFLMKKGLNAAILLCANGTCCFLPLGFWFESNYTRRLLTEAGEYIKEGYIRFSAREESIQEFIEKKREQYSQFQSTGIIWEVYQNFYDDVVFNQLKALHPYLIDRNAKIGEQCAEVWISEHNQLILDNTGNLSPIYSGINELSDRNKIMNEILSVAEDMRKPFVWANVSNKISDIALKDKWIRKELRIYFERNYYTVYLKEYNATNLYNFYLIDKRIDFHFGKPTDTIADYQWFETFLKLLGLEKLLDAPDYQIVFIKRSRFWIKLLQKYIDICNQYVEGRDVFEFVCANALENADIDLEINRIRNMIKMQNKKEFLGGGWMDKKANGNTEIGIKVDVLIMVATIEEEQAIRNNSEWETEKTSDGYKFFVREEGLNFALARAVDMGMEKGAFSTQYFVDLLKPRYLAMAGFCAGNHKKVHLVQRFSINYTQRIPYLSVF